MLGVEHLVLDLFLAQQLGKVFRDLDGGGTHQHRLTTFVAILDILDDGVVFVLGGEIDQVRVVLADHGAVGGNHHHLQAVDLLKFVGLGVCGAGHAGELVVEAEIILEGDGGQRLVLVLDGHPLLGLDGLVQALRPAPAGHGAAREFVDDDHLVVLHDVVHVPLVQGMGAQGGDEVVHEGNVGGIVEALAFLEQPGLEQQLFYMLMPLLGEIDLLGLLVDTVVAGAVLLRLRLELGDQLVDLEIERRLVVDGPGDDQGGARLVDENGIHLIDDGVVQAALHLVLHAEGHVVAQVVEAEFVVGAVGDVGGIGGALLLGALPRQDHPGAEPQEFVQLAHPLRVALGQIVVDRDHVHALARQGVEIGRQGRHQRLALAGAHFGDLALVKHHATDELDIEMAHVEDPLARLAHHGEGLGQEFVQRSPIGQALAEFSGLGAQRLIGERRHRVFQGVDLLHHHPHAFQQAFIAAAEYLADYVCDHKMNDCLGKKLKKG